MFDLHETSVLIRLKNQNLILRILSPSACFVFHFLLAIICCYFIFLVSVISCSLFHLQVTCPVCFCVLYFCMNFARGDLLVSLFCFFFSSPFQPFSFLVFCCVNVGAVECCSCVFSLSPSFSVCRGCAVPDGGGPQTDTSAARGDGWYSKLKIFLLCAAPFKSQDM